MKTSGKRVKQSLKKELNKLLKELLEQNAFTKTSGPKYRYFAGIRSSMLKGFNLHALFRWINSHKKKIFMEKVAR